MLQKKRTSLDTSNVGRDLFASVVVFLVALPLCMGIAIASGVPVAAGLITGIIGGLVVGSLAGAPLAVSGPAAGLTVIVFDLVQKLGLEVLGIVVLMAGAMQLLAGCMRLGQWFRAVSPAVINGMLAGIGVLIFSSQFHVMVDDKPRGSGLENLLTIPSAIAKGMPLPTLGTAEQRSVRTDALKAAGTLHERQVQLWETVAENLAIVGGEAELKLDDQQHAWLVAEQQELNAGLAAMASKLEAQGLTSADARSGKDIAVAVQGAQAAGQTALAELEQLHAHAAIAAQRQAAESIEGVLCQLKNHDWAAKIGILTILAIIGWQTLTPRRFRLLPAPLIAVLVATALAFVLTLPVLYVEVPDRLLDDLHFPSWTVVQRVPFNELLLAATVLAVVASAETLLCATAVDQMHRGQRTKYDRELFAQGVGNMACGVFGALPMTGVIVRSAANVNAGARTRLSAIMHGMWLLLFVGLIPFTLRYIPTAALAAILVYTGYKLVDPKKIKTLWQYGKSEAGIYFATVIMIVATDLLTGVIVGVVLSAIKLLYTFSHLTARVKDGPEPGQQTLYLNGAATFIRLPQLAAALEQVAATSELHVRFEDLSYIDHACLDLLITWEKQHEATGGRLVIDWGSLTAKFNGNGNGKKKPKKRREEEEPVAA